jgi:prepilin-type N-terminal cleavage/methylation domain-containing protein
MRRASGSGFTLIELMVALAVIAVLTAIAYPSYRSYMQRGIRSQGQQFLQDLAQRQEQYFLDQRSYTDSVVTNGGVAGPGQIALAMTDVVLANYSLVIVPCAVPCNTYTMTLTVNAGSVMSQSTDVSGNPNTDGNLIINNLQQRWREVDGNNIYNAKATPSSVGDCLWEDGHCVPG